MPQRANETNRVPLTRKTPAAVGGLCLALLLAPMASLARGVAEVPTEAVDDLMRRHIQSRHIPAASVAVVSQGRLLLARGYGTADLESGADADEHTVYELASITKQFTAAAVLLLAEEGKISLDDRITRVLEGLPEAWEAVTVRHLLQHTSGIASNAALPELVDEKDYGQREFIDIVAGRPLDFEPGTQWAYSNTGYFLLGMLIEKTSGLPYGEFLAQRIFHPLGMASTRMNDRGLVIPRRAAGYALDKAELRNDLRVSPTQSYAGGGLVTTVVDLARWEAALCQKRLLQPSSYDLMLQAASLSDGQSRPYGLGVQLSPYRGHQRVWHGGGIPGFDTYMVRFVKDGLTVIVLTNLNRAGSDHIAHGVAELYLPSLKASARQPIEDTDPEGTAFLKRVIDSASRGEGQPEWFAPRWRAFFLPDRVKEGPHRLGMFGPLNAFDLMAETVDNGVRMREYNAVFGTVNFRCRFKLDADGKVAEIGLGKDLGGT